MLTKKDLLYFEDKLLQLKKELIQGAEFSSPSSFENSGELSSYDNHFADTATELDDREKQMIVNDRTEKLLEEISEALERIQENTYGFCVDTGDCIPYARLEALPYAKRTLEAQEKFENEGIQIDQQEKSFATPKEDKRGDQRIDIADKLQYEHGNSSY